MKNNLDMLKGIFVDQVAELSEDQRAAIGAKLEKIVEARVDAKIKFQTEVIEAEAKEKYDALLKESTSKFDKSVKTLEEQLLTKATAYKSKLQGTFKGVTQKITESKEKEISTFKTVMVEKLDKYLKLEMDKKIPETYVEAAAKVQILEPIVEGFKTVMNNNYIKFDEENFSLLKDSRNEIVKVRSELAESVKQNMNLNESLINLKRSVKISKVCEGLTKSQQEKAVKLLESYDVDEMESRFATIRDIIIESSDMPVKPDVKKDEEEDEEVTVKETQVPADMGGDAGEGEKADDEDDVMASDKKDDEVVESDDVRAGKDDKSLIEAWAAEFRRKI